MQVRGKKDNGPLIKRCPLRIENLKTYSSKDALIGHDTHGEVVNTGCVILAAHHLRGHVAWCARRILSIVLSPHTSNTKVSDPHVT